MNLLTTSVTSIFQQIGGTGASVDVENNAVVAQTATTFVNLPPTAGTTNILIFSANGAGADLALQAGSITGQTIVWDNGLTEWVITTPPAALLDFDNELVLASSNPTFVNIPATNGSSTILQFAANGFGVDLQLTSSGSAGKVIRSDGSVWIVDFPILH